MRHAAVHAGQKAPLATGLPPEVLTAFVLKRQETSVPTRATDILAMFWKTITY